MGQQRSRKPSVVGPLFCIVGQPLKSGDEPVVASTDPVGPNVLRPENESVVAHEPSAGCIRPVPEQRDDSRKHLLRNVASGPVDAITEGAQ